MAAPTAEDLAAIEARLRAILAPYEDRLETATIYGIPTLRRPGAKAHDWFAFVKPASKHVGLLPAARSTRARRCARRCRPRWRSG